MTVQDFLVKNFLKENFNKSHSLGQFVFASRKLLDDFIQIRKKYKSMHIVKMTIPQIEDLIIDLQYCHHSTLFPDQVEIHIYGAMAALLYDKNGGDLVVYKSEE